MSWPPFGFADIEARAGWQIPHAAGNPEDGGRGMGFRDVHSTVGGRTHSFRQDW